MSKFTKKKKIAAVIVGAGIVAIGAGSAYAYWSTTGGTTTGSATTGTSVGVTVTQTNSPTGLAPGVAPIAITGTIKNLSSQNAYVTSLAVTFTVNPVLATPAKVCSAANYGLITGTSTTALTATTPGAQTLTLPVGTELAATSGTAAFPSFSIGFVNTAANQDGCQGATVTLTETAS